MTDWHRRNVNIRPDQQEAIEELGIVLSDEVRRYIDARIDGDGFDEAVHAARVERLKADLRDLKSERARLDEDIEQREAALLSERRRRDEAREEREREEREIAEQFSRESPTVPRDPENAAIVNIAQQNGVTPERFAAMVKAADGRGGDGEDIRCEHCGHRWNTQSGAVRPTCPSCGIKTDRQ